MLCNLADIAAGFVNYCEEEKEFATFHVDLSLVGSFWAHSLSDVVLTKRFIILVFLLLFLCASCISEIRFLGFAICLPPLDKMWSFRTFRSLIDG